MAIFHINVKTCSKARHSRSSGYARACYILREGPFAKHPEKPAVVFAGNMPSWVGDDPKTYFKEADRYERANGRLCKTVMAALPLELDQAERAVLANTFAKKIIGDEPLPYILAIHDTPSNPHFHLMVSERVNDGIKRSPEQWFSRHDSTRPQGTGAKKTEALKSKEWLFEVRETWAASINLELERKGLPQRVSHLSLEALEALDVAHVAPSQRLKDIPEVSPKPKTIRRRKHDDLDLAL